MDIVKCVALLLQNSNYPQIILTPQQQECQQEQRKGDANNVAML
jgi:hypothetical protein